MSEIRYLSIADVLALHQAIMEKHNSIAVTNSSCCAILANILKQLHASASNLETIAFADMKRGRGVDEVSSLYR